MRDKVALGLFFMLAYIGFILVVPHRTPSTQGIESDFVCTYIPQSQELHDAITGVERDKPFYDYFESQSWLYHGIPYPLMLNALAPLFKKDTPVRGWHYFKANKMLSAVMGASVLLLVIIVFGIKFGWIIAAILALHPMLFSFSYACSSDIIAVVLALWAMYFIRSGKWWVVAIAGLFYAASVGVRHEYIALLPVGIYYVCVSKDKWKIYPAAFLVPVVLIILPDSRSWVTSSTVPYKYIEHAGREDEFPPQMFEVDMDTIENYYVHQVNTARKYYPGLLGVIKIAKFNFVKVLTRDIFRTIKYVFGQIWFALVPIFLFARWNQVKWIVIALAVHVFVTNVFGVWAERYFLLEIIVLLVMGIYYIIWYLDPLKSFGKTYGGRKYIWVVDIVLFLVIAVAQVGETKDAVGYRTTISGERYEHFRGNLTQYILLKNERMPRVLARRGQAAFIAGWNWHPWPPKVRNLYEYCIRYDIDYVLWSGFERVHRSEWENKLRFQQVAASGDSIRVVAPNCLPEFTMVDFNYRYGSLYYVNRDGR